MISFTDAHALIPHSRHPLKFLINTSVDIMTTSKILKNTLISYHIDSN